MRAVPVILAIPVAAVALAAGGREGRGRSKSPAPPLTFGKLPARANAPIDAIPDSLAAEIRALRGTIARSFRGGRAVPTTALDNAAGSLTYVHAGGLPNAGALDAEVGRYALRG